MLSNQPYQLELRGRWLVANFPEPWAVVSWAIVNGAWQQTRQIAWLFLAPNEIADVADVRSWMQARLHADGLGGAVGLMTSRRLHSYVEQEGSDGDAHAWALGTVGYSNALRVGDPSGHREQGTINLMIAVNQPLGIEAALELLGVISEAKAVATLEASIPSRRTGDAASGTGTDYLVLAWPLQGPRLNYSGKHTSVGAAAGAAALGAIREGIRIWKSEQHV